MSIFSNFTEVPEFSFTEISLTWFLITASVAMIFSLIEAWLATLIVYGKLTFLKKVFPVPHNLVRSHVDYLIMAALLCLSYFLCIHLRIEPPAWLVALLCFGVLYNPFGFFLQAINPKIGRSDTTFGRIVVCASFLPTTLGFGYVFISVILALLS